MSGEDQKTDESLRQLITDYVGKRIELVKLETADISARVLSLFLVYFLLMFILFIAIIMLSMLAGILLSERLKSFTLGFGIVSGVYMILFILMYAYRNQIAEKFLANQFIKSFFKEHNGNQNS